MKQAALAFVLILAAATAAQAQTRPKRVVTPPGTVAKPVAQKTSAPKSISLPPLKEMRPGLEAKAKVKADSATATGMATVPNGSLQSRTIEERGGRLIYAFRIRAADKNVREVMVDAMTGKIVPMPSRFRLPAPGGSARTPSPARPS